MKITQKIVDVVTGEETLIERELTAREVAEHEAVQTAAKQAEVEKKAKTTQRAAILERLGLTEEEAKLLLG